MELAPAMNDSDLLARYLRHRDEGAFAALVRNHERMVVGAAWRRTGDPEMARDVAQQVFAILAQKASTLVGRRSIAGWLHIAATHLAVRTRNAEDARQRRQGHAASTPAPHSEPDAGQLLEEALSGLGATEREALVMHYFEDRSYTEMALALGVKEAAIRKRVSRALDRLAEQLRRRGFRGSAMTALVGAAAMQAELPAVLVTAATLSASTAAATASSSALLFTTLMSNTAFKIAAVAVAITAIPIVWQHQVNAELRAELLEVRRAAVPAAAEPIVEQPGVDLVSLRAELAALSTRLSTAKLRGEDLKGKLADGMKNLDRVQQEVLVKLGKTEDLARTFASKLALIMPVIAEMKDKPPVDATAQEKLEQAMKVAMELLPHIGQVRQLDEEPEQAARFTSIVLADLMQLPPETTAEVERAIAEGYATLKRDGLTLSSRPKEKEGAEAWGNRRHAVDATTTRAVVALLPEAARNHPFLKTIGDDAGLLLPPELADFGTGGISEMLKAKPSKAQTPGAPKQP